MLTGLPPISFSRPHETLAGDVILQAPLQAAQSPGANQDTKLRWSF